MHRIPCHVTILRWFVHCSIASMCAKTHGLLSILVGVKQHSRTSTLQLMSSFCVHSTGPGGARNTENIVLLVSGLEAAPKKSAPASKTRYIFRNPGEWVVLLASPGGAGRWSAPTTRPMVVTSAAARGGGAVCAAPRVFESPSALYSSARHSACFGAKRSVTLRS